jgi:hypothetical protein
MSKTIYATSDPALTGGSAITGASGAPTPVTDLQVSGTGNPTVPVKLRATSGSLSMTTTTGLTFTGSSTGSTLQFSGSLTDINTALATLRYTRTGIGTDTIEASLVNAGEVFFPDNNHLYEYVSYSSNWNNAQTNAATRTKYGATGYLTTITSAAENDFVAARLLNAGWMGASDSVSEGDWKWVAGQENGTSFWSGDSSGSTVSGRYANWGSGEPNNSGDEDCAQFLTGGTGKWNDLSCSTSTLPGYVAEYGSDSSPITISTKNIPVTTQAANQSPNAPTSLGPTAKINGTWSTDITPSLNFTLSDPDVGNTIKYQIQIDNDSNFSTPVVDYTSALSTQGAKTFTVGQAASGGSYTTGSSGQALSNSATYYWRVKAVDNSASGSSYVTANSGGIAFRVDTTAPDQPPTPSTSPLLTSDTTPSWTLGTVHDNLATTGTLTVEWSQDPDFIHAVSTDQLSWPASSYTQPSPLVDGTWYFRIKATDAASNTSTYSIASTVTIDTQGPTTPGNVTPTQTPTNDSTPSFTWSPSTDTAISSTAPYTIEWSTDSTFGTFTGASSTTNGFTIPVGSALADGTWYFRVKSTDSLGHASAYAQVTSIVVDASAPTIPGAPVMTTTATKNLPTWTWSPSTDNGLGLADPAYVIEWSQDPDFISHVFTATSSTLSFTHQTVLNDGTWYIRVKAIDAVSNSSAYSLITATVIDTSTPLNVENAAASQLPKIVEIDSDTIIAQTTSNGGEDILLNDFRDYVSGTGKYLSLHIGQVIHFTVDNERHSATIKEIGSDYVIVTIASTPTDVRINKGETLTYDVNHDGKNDISIDLTSATQSTAQMVFKQLTEKAPTARSVATTPSPLDRNCWNWPWLLAVAIMVLCGIVLLIIFRKRKDRLKQ